MRQPYCEVTDVENYLLTEVEEYFEPQVEQWILGVSAMLDTMANRKLVADAVGSGEDYEIKYVDGNGRTKLVIDDAQVIDEVKIDDVVVTDAVGYPKVAPHYMLSRDAGFPRGEQNVSIAGTFGMFAEVPADIRVAATIIVAGIINASQNKTGKKSESIGNYAVTFIDDKGIADYERALSIITAYRKVSF